MLTQQAPRLARSWSASPTAGHDVHGQSAICDEHTGRTVAIVYDGDAHAAFIARACNAYDELLATLENLLAEVCTTEAGLSATTPIAREHAAQAIAKARGEP